MEKYYVAKNEKRVGETARLKVRVYSGNKEILLFEAVKASQEGLGYSFVTVEGKKIFITGAAIIVEEIKKSESEPDQPTSE